MKILHESETVYIVYGREIGSKSWFSLQSTDSPEIAKRYLEYNRKYNDETYEKGAGREYVLVKRVSTFEILE